MTIHMSARQAAHHVHVEVKFIVASNANAAALQQQLSETIEGLGFRYELRIHEE